MLNSFSPSARRLPDAFDCLKGIAFGPSNVEASIILFEVIAKQGNKLGQEVSKISLGRRTKQLGIAKGAQEICSDAGSAFGSRGRSGFCLAKASQVSLAYTGFGCDLTCARNRPSSKWQSSVFMMPLVVTDTPSRRVRFMPVERLVCVIHDCQHPMGTTKLS